ncbi:MAG: family oxidoreductase [Bacteroidota bacterium]|nr:family oxidoreductase [Bacteroidota bacterium]
MNYTLITGASKGIGKAIAIEAANRGMNLLLVARSEQLLVDLAKELSAKNVSVKILAADLFDADASKKIFEFVKEHSLNVNMLVNNAGMGFYGNFDEGDLQNQLNVMKLNMDACVRLTYDFLKNSDATQRRYILNTVSTGAYQPVPKMSIYAATKTFMLFFSRGIREELKKKNVYVTALCPGGTETEFFVPAKMEKVIKKNAAFMMLPDRVAKVGLNAVMKNKSVAIPGGINMLGAIASKLLPHDLVVPVSGSIFET